MTFGSIVLAAFFLVLFGMLIGCTLSERGLGRRAKRQAEMQRSLDRQWQELQVAKVQCKDYADRMGRFETVSM
jgi:hypothetical protein